jgi:hypothetical protein
MSWAEIEFEELDLGDVRLNQRAIKIMEDRVGSRKNNSTIIQNLG